jgi:hypothetical protein
MGFENFFSGLLAHRCDLFYQLIPSAYTAVQLNEQNVKPVFGDGLLSPPIIHFSIEGFAVFRLHVLQKTVIMDHSEIGGVRMDTERIKPAIQRGEL